jgi:hypothetical protein
MVRSMGIEVSSAAKDLGVSEQRVRSLLSNDLLEGQKIAGRWFVDPESMERWRSRSSRGGRPFSRENSWGILLAASGQEPLWLSPWDRSRLRNRLSLDWRKWIPKVRNRARLRAFRAHPGQLKRISSDSRLILGGVSAASHYGADIKARDELEAYVRDRDIRKLVNRYKLVESSSPNILLHVVESKWPLGLDSQARVMPAAVVALDLIESPDSRSRRAGHALLRQLREGFRDHH